MKEALWHAMELRERASSALEAVRGLPLQQQQRHEEVMGLQLKSPPTQPKHSQIPVAKQGGYKAPPAYMVDDEVEVTVYQSSAASYANRPAVGQPEEEPASAPRLHGFTARNPQ